VHRKQSACCVLGALLASLGGCVNPKEEFGKIYYMDGAGNWGFGVVDVPEGLASAGYKGDVEIFVWTSSFSPAVDQVNIIGNKLRASLLSGKIRDYLRRQPGQSVHLIALSAGTGIAVWAIEGLPDGVMIDNLVLLGSSLSYNYDMSKALRHVRGKVYVFYSAHDEVLTTAVPALGTVDRTHEDSAGLVGLHPSDGDSDKIVNVRWSQEYSRYGWTGAHTDATGRMFIQHVVAPQILGRAQGQPSVTSAGMPSKTFAPVASAIGPASSVRTASHPPAHAGSLGCQQTTSQSDGP
jgi:hypothetical protein